MTGRINQGDQEDLSREDLNKLLPRIHHQTQHQKNLILLFLPIHPAPLKQLLQHQEDQAGTGEVFPAKRIINYCFTILYKKSAHLNRADFFIYQAG